MQLTRISIFRIKPIKLNNESTTKAISNCLISRNSENPRGFSFRFVFAKLCAETRN